ncbi:DUF4286 family protein [Flammeovirga kamogawensis]|uniref:DUF4286 family protein n=1 Tax=Flammeovirga kamogawensis TaxID=373891 RepID=A0ABX8GRM7_9BACT|nr:DUF4286 family protein [Flammeovirga kamogawensis]MBB6463728.1 hypothetical protein [Flammeovirga kamogawensis]QWG06225.1 DUF4286 family protein [Flammeovirga kamogawensis]TRX68057.1 DUF4286 family protein [Flammeovirga kamogawensis]
MILYNISFHVEDEMLSSWKEWMKSFFIPEVLKTECFQSYKLMKLLSEKAENQGTNFALMLDVDNLSAADKFMRTHEAELHAILKEKFGEKVNQFRSILREEIL